MSLLQNNYLQHIIKGYKRTLRIALKREAAISLLNLYIKVTALQRAVKVINYSIKHNIKTVVNDIWEATQESVIQRVRGRGRSRHL